MCTSINNINKNILFCLIIVLLNDHISKQIQNGTLLNAVIELDLQYCFFLQTYVNIITTVITFIEIR